MSSPFLQHSFQRMTPDAISLAFNGMGLTPRRKRLTVSREMELASTVGPALRALRKAAGLTQQALAERAQVGFAMISSYERGNELPQLSTLSRLLEAMGLDFLAFAHALAPESPAPLRPGSARAAWVALLMRNGVEARTLDGAAALALTSGDAKAEADLVASAEEAARQLAAASIAAVRRAELSLVAESPSDYDAGKGKR